MVLFKFFISMGSLLFCTNKIILCIFILSLTTLLSSLTCFRRMFLQISWDFLRRPSCHTQVYICFDHCLLFLVHGPNFPFIIVV